ncbi:uncharacterized protein LOC124447604 isoform X2 [Xenia sp. Carnegie-2017]|uniref:uncharacterized protein LOC124447604 isoform X2 n=1 Tax=Xenia sp. Carnegie-2017 TaxID=2897299 RepID=UPI001F04AA82|nr:uncharacterized protein LOC124447604 isoform X2 [Xenia sp. Carnegie-2017]
MPGKKESRRKQEKKRLKLQRISDANKGKQDECEVESSDDEEVDEREETDVDEEKKSIETNNSPIAEETAGDVEKKLIETNNSLAFEETDDVKNKSIGTNNSPDVEEKPHSHQDEKTEVNFVATCQDQSSHVPDIDSQQDHLSGDISGTINKEEAGSHCDEVENSVEDQDNGSAQTSSGDNHDNKESSNVTSELHKLFSSVANARSNRAMGDAISKIRKVVNFEPSNLAAEEEYLQWIIDESISSKTNPFQHLFLCAVLGHLVDIKKRNQSKNIGNDSKETTVLKIPEPKERARSAFDRLLECVKFCSENIKIAPLNFKYLLDSCASTIVMGSSKPGWLTYAAYFRYFFGMENVVDFEIEKYNYKEEEFKCLLPLLIFGVQPIGRAGRHQKFIYRRYLKRILQSAPNDEILFQISQDKDFFRFFYSSSDREFFFLDIYKEILNNDPGNFTKKLAALRELSNNVKRNVYGIIEKYVLEFFDKGENPLEEDRDAVFNLISDLPVEKFVIILESISKLQSSSKRKLLPQVLGDKKFESLWKQISNINKRFLICDVWISHTITSEKESLGLVKAILKAVDILESCYLVCSDYDLIARLGRKVVDKLICEDPVQVFDGLKEFDNYSTLVQDCILSLIQEMFKINSNLLKNASVILKFFPARSRYSGFELGLMNCALDALKPPENQTDMDDRVFADLLQYCDVWIKLIGAKDVLSKNDCYKSCETIWERIEDRIMQEDVTVSFLEKIEDHQKQLSLIFRGLKGGDDRIRAKIAKLFRTEKDLRKKVELLLKAENFSRKVLSGRRIKESIKERDVESLKINEVNDDFWKEYTPLLEELDPINSLLSSASFVRIAKRNLQNNPRFLVCGNEDDIIDRNCQLSLFQLLSKEGVLRFKAEWFKIFANPSALTVGQINDLLGDMDLEMLESEIVLLENHFEGQLPSDVKLYVNDCTRFPLVLELTKNVIDLLQSLGILNSIGCASISKLKDFHRKFNCNVNEIAIENLHVHLKQVEQIISHYNIDRTDEMIFALGNSRELIRFIREIVKEDIRVLIDAVEEHSDEAVSASLVSDLIQVHGFMVPIITKCEQSFPADRVLKTLVNDYEKHREMIQKIRHCSGRVHSLRGLYQNVANREEMTREVIRNCLSYGVFNIELDAKGFCYSSMIYRKEKDEVVKKSMDDLQDLRSRAHLILSSEQNPEQLFENKPKQDINFMEFIEQINLLSDIENTIIDLQASGHVNYQRNKNWRNFSGKKDLENIKTVLFEDLHEWQLSLRNARENHYFLNYFYSDQLRVLYDFIITQNICEIDLQNVLTLMKFVDPTIDEKHLVNFKNLYDYHESGKTPSDIIALIGHALDKIFSNTCPALSLRRMYDDSTHVTPIVSVRKGELFVIALEERSPHTVNMLMSLYENTTNAFPEPHQVMFCNETTPFEQLQIFLNRCFNNNKNLACDSLFCLANVELLSNELQFYLIDYIKKKEFQDCDQDYLLAIICRGGAHHHIIEEFSKFVHHISGMSYPEIAGRFKSKWPHVKCVTSALQGLGKTEYIRRDAFQLKTNVVSFPISGQVIESKIIERLKELNLKHFQCLHFDFGEVDDPILLDTFIFQLIITGMVSYGTQMYSLHNEQIYIEIANSFNNRLVDNLVIARCFSRVELTWNDYIDLHVGSKITSNVQVVCQYLNALDKDQLDKTDVYFTGPRKVKPLSEKRCRQLLRKYYGTTNDTTFTALNTFLGFLADQLRKFSRSAFFSVENLKLMLENKASGVRVNLLQTLLKVSQDFASRSLTMHSSNQPQQTSLAAQNIVQRMKGMIQWEQSNHLLIVFQSVDSQTIAAFYREKSKVPPDISELLKSQTVRRNCKELVDFKKLSQESLHEMLEKIVRTKLSCKRTIETLSSGYALTPDNMLKMILIILRVRAKIPVIIMGETGCGKTSLVEYLASTCEVPFTIYNIHAGRTEDDIREFIEKKNEEACMDNSQRWIFLDEINTCHHLGLINEIVCHHTLLGRPISRKLVFLAACNPYKLRSLKSSSTAGLEGKRDDDECSKLVYRVHPLPESMVDYVWDYGSLTPQDEKVYIGRMVNEFPGEYQQVLTELLASSQNFIRDAEKNPFCVSLRDVRRCILLVKWFIDTLKKRKLLMKKILENGEEIPKVPSRLKEAQEISERYDDLPEIKSFVLALGHCYLSRLQTVILRKEYIRSLVSLLEMIHLSEESFTAIIRMEQEDYLLRMELPEGTARNVALRENVFVMLVSILNRIPVFVVGKPGCSKSLAIQLIRSNLRGKDSKDAFFKTLPHLYVVSYQGSESSTSEGIEEIFKKASNYKKHNSKSNVLPVVLLDEVGLAENSPNNPLKVLHSILEPGKGELPEVAVVGISNWALDAAKMNRAIHLSRPEPSAKDLGETAISLYQGDKKSEDDIDKSTEKVLRLIAEAYHVYRLKQLHPNFHGLRDYYSLVKSLKCGSCSDMEQINIALKRNFGGIPKESSNVQEVFNERLKTVISASKTESYIPVTRLIEENIKDLKARHLMLVSNGDSAIGILKQHVSYSTKETITIFGSNFEEDKSDDYNYRMLSRIILCMERNCILILRDLECIYGSLYDMLNQNYSVVGGRKNCRVALGANSNPMCYVNDGFRCIVLVDHDQVDYSDPPFLNRFEKQLLRFSDMLNETQQEIMKELESWVHQMSSVEGFRDKFKEEDMFIGFNEDTLPSLVLYHSHDFVESKDVIVKKCKDDLMWIATPDGVLRTVESDRYNEDSGEVEKLSNEYFEKPIHSGLASFILHFVKRQHLYINTYDAESEACSITFMMTHATVHTDISRCLHMENMSFQLERLGAYKSGKQLEDRIHLFFKSEKELLIIQYKPELDAEHMLLTRSIIEEKRKAFAKKFMEAQCTMQRKHVCMIVHVRRASHENTPRWQLNFLSGWNQVFLDTLEIPSIPVNEMVDQSIHEVLSNSAWSFQRFAENCIVWCFNCLKYSHNAMNQESVLRIAKNLFTSDCVTKTIQDLVLKESGNYTGNTNEQWQVKVACDVELLWNSSTLSSAMEQHLALFVRQPLAKLVYFLENENCWPPHLLNKDVADDEEMWCDLLSDESIFDFKKIPECKGVDSYSIDGIRHDLMVPFSQVIAKRMEKARGFIIREYAETMEIENNFDENGELKKSVLLEQLQRYSNALEKHLPCLSQLAQSYVSSYMADMFELASDSFHIKMNHKHRISVSLCAFLSFAQQWQCIEEYEPTQFFALLHLFLWTSKEDINRILELVNGFLEFDFIKYFEESVQDYVDLKKAILPLYFFNDERLCVDNSGKDKDLWGDEKEDDNEEDENEGDDGDKEEEDDNEECFENVLVTSICEVMFPSKKSVQKNGGLLNWINNASFLLSLSSKVCNTAPAYLYLRLCVEFGSTVVHPCGISEEHLFILNKIGKKLDPNYLDDDRSLLMIQEQLLDKVEDRLRGDEKSMGALRTFMSQYYSRCVEASMESQPSSPVIQHIFSLDNEDLLLMTPVVYRLLYIEEACCSGIFFDIILRQSIDESNSCLHDIDNAFKERLNDKDICHDSYSAVMICDLIQFIQGFDESFQIEDLEDHDGELMKYFRSATSVIAGSGDAVGLVLLTSVAFLRGFYAMLSKKPDILIRETQYSNVLGEINSLLEGDNGRRSSIRLYFLKQLFASGITMYDLQKLCCEGSQLPVMKNMFEKNCNFAKIEFSSATRMDGYKEVKEALLLQSEGNDGKLDGVLRKCENSSNYRLALVGLVINTFYVQRAASNLNDNEEKLVRKLFKKFERFPHHLKQLVSKLLSLEKFVHHGLQVSSESSTKQIGTSLLILHVLCVVLSSDGIENSPLLQYVINQKNFHPTTLLGHGEKHRMLDQYRYLKHASFKNCLCKLHLQYYGQLEKCPNCGTKMDAKDHGDSISNEALKSYFDSAKSKDWETCTVNMEPSVYRALHLIVNACFYGGIAAGLSSNEMILKTLFPDNEDGSFADACLNQINEDLKCLQTILSCKRQTAIDVMHLVVEESTPLLQGKTKDGTSLQNTNDCVRWENKFVNVVEDLFQKAHGSVTLIKESRIKFEMHFQIEDEVQELDEYPSDYEKQDEELKRLFRVTKNPSFTELCSKFFNSSNEFQKQHCVLAVLLSWFDELPYISCLYPLLKWSRLVSTELTHLISRKEAQTCRISDFIDGNLQLEKNAEKKEEYKEKFCEFKYAWEKIYELVNQQLDDHKDIPFIGEDHPIGYCLLDGELSIYLRKAIKILQTMQNSFLNVIMAIALRTNHPAVSFLKKSENCCGVMSISLQEAKEKDIINMEWSNKFLRYTQNPEYGCGEDIDYDFEQIESKLANEVVLGKLYLTDISSTFIFSHELFHSSANVLMKLRDLCPQSPTLPEGIYQGIETLKERRKQDARNLLQNIEIIIYLLHSDPKSIEEIQNMELVEFADTFKDKLPRPFPVDLLPEPKKSIHLTHIAALYEALEDVLADGTIEGLPIQFRADLKVDIKEKLNSLVHHRNGPIKAKQFLKVLRRFAFRYLSAEKFHPEAKTPLRSCLQEPSLWTPGDIPEENIIPRELMLANIKAIIKHIQQEQSGQTGGVQNVRRNQPTATKRKGNRRSMAMNFDR